MVSEKKVLNFMYVMIKNYINVYIHKKKDKVYKWQTGMYVCLNERVMGILCIDGLKNILNKNFIYLKKRQICHYWGCLKFALDSKENA